MLSRAGEGVFIHCNATWQHGGKGTCIIKLQYRNADMSIVLVGVVCNGQVGSIKHRPGWVR